MSKESRIVYVLTPVNTGESMGIVHVHHEAHVNGRLAELWDKGWCLTIIIEEDLDHGFPFIKSTLVFVKRDDEPDEQSPIHVS